MRRQVGATHFDIDATQGYATFAIAQSAVLDWALIADTADSAGYTVTAYQFVASGNVLTAHCEGCDSDVPVLRMPGTGQDFELIGDVPEPGRVLLEGLATGWEEGHITLDVYASSPLSN